MRSAHRVALLGAALVACRSSMREAPPPTVSTSIATATFSDIATPLPAQSSDGPSNESRPRRDVSHTAEASSLCTTLCSLRPNFWRSEQGAVRVRDLPIGGHDPATVLVFVSPAVLGSAEQVDSMNRLGKLPGSPARFDLEVVVAGAVEPSTKALVDKSTTNAQSIDEPYLAGLGVEKFPETWVVDRKGRVRAKLFGARKLDDPLFVDFITGIADGLDCNVSIEPASVGMIDRPPKITGPDAAQCASK